MLSRKPVMDMSCYCNIILNGIDTKFQHVIHHLCAYVCGKSCAYTSSRYEDNARQKLGAKICPPSSWRVARRPSGHRVNGFSRKGQLGAGSQPRVPPKPEKLHGFNTLFLGRTQIHFRKNKSSFFSFWEAKRHDKTQRPFPVFGGHGRVAP